MPKYILLTAVKVALSAGLLCWMVSRAQVDNILHALAQADLMHLVVAACLPFLSTLIVVKRWGGLLRAQGVDIAPPRLLQSCMAAAFLRHFLPSTIGGDAIRFYDTWKSGAGKTVAAAALVLDRFLGLSVLVLFGAIALCWPQAMTKRYPIFYVWGGLAGVAVIVCLWLMFFSPLSWSRLLVQWASRAPRQLRGLPAKVANAVSLYHGKTGQLLSALGCSILLQMNVITIYYHVARSLGFEIAYSEFFVIVPIALLIMLLPISINGIGVRESVFVFLLAAYGIDPAQAVAFAWLELGVFMSYGIFGGAVYALRSEHPASAKCSAT